MFVADRNTPLHVSDTDFVAGRLFVLGEDLIAFVWESVGLVTVFTRVGDGDDFAEEM